MLAANALRTFPAFIFKNALAANIGNGGHCRLSIADCRLSLGQRVNVLRVRVLACGAGFLPVFGGGCWLANHSESGWNAFISRKTRGRYPPLARAKSGKMPDFTGGKQVPSRRRPAAQPAGPDNGAPKVSQGDKPVPSPIGCRFHWKQRRTFSPAGSRFRPS